MLVSPSAGTRSAHKDSLYEYTLTKIPISRHPSASHRCPQPPAASATATQPGRPPRRPRRRRGHSPPLRSRPPARRELTAPGGAGGPHPGRGGPRPPQPGGGSAGASRSPSGCKREALLGSQRRFPAAPGESRAPPAAAPHRTTRQGAGGRAHPALLSRPPCRWRGGRRGTAGRRNPRGKGDGGRGISGGNVGGAGWVGGGARGEQRWRRVGGREGPWGAEVSPGGCRRRCPRRGWRERGRGGRLGRQRCASRVGCGSGGGAASRGKPQRENRIGSGAPVFQREGSTPNESLSLKMLFTKV